MVTVKTISKLEKDIEKIKINVKEYIKQKQELFYAEIRKDNPNDDRVDRYEEQIEILNMLIKKESFELLDRLLFEKTYYRLLMRIEKGTENLINIYNYPDQWSICKIEEYNGWLDENSLIFSIEEKGLLIFNKKRIGQKYSTNSNKWQ